MLIAVYEMNRKIVMLCLEMRRSDVIEKVPHLDDVLRLVKTVDLLNTGCTGR